MLEMHVSKKSNARKKKPVTMRSIRQNVLEAYKSGEPNIRKKKPTMVGGIKQNVHEACIEKT